jgi:hypothetical protein
MQPVDLIPVPDVIPVGWGWFQVLLTTTWVLHIILMNMMLGGTLIALVNSIKGGTANLGVSRFAGKILPFTVALAVNVGVAPLLFVQVLYGHFVYPSSILIAVSWLSVILFLIIAYYGVYLFRFKFDSWGQGRNLVLGLSALLFLVIAFLFTNNWTLALTPEKWSEYFNRPGGTMLNLTEPTLWPRYLHMMLGALAVGGLSLAVFGQRKPDTDPVKPALITQGMGWFKWVTLVQVLVGTWWLMALRPEVMKLFMGGNMVATAAFGIGFVMALVTLFFSFRGKILATVWTTVMTLVAMAVMREYVRYGSLREHFTPDQLEVHPQYSSLILFLAVFVIGTGSVWYMLKLALNAGKEV